MVIWPSYQMWSQLDIRLFNNTHKYLCGLYRKIWPWLLVIHSVSDWYLGPALSHNKIWNSLPVTITSLSSFPNFKKKTARVFSKIHYWTGKATHCCTIYVTALLRTRWPQLKAWWFLEVTLPHIKIFINTVH